MRSAASGWGTEYQTSTYSSFDHIPRYVFARSSRRRDGDDLEPGIVGAELDAVALEPDDELLTGANADVLAAGGQVRLRGRDEPVALLRDRLPVGPVGEELVERARPRTPGRWTSSRMPRCASSSGGGDRREALARGAVREQAVVELVRRADALPLDRLRDAVRAVREHTVHARGEGRRLPVHVRPRPRAAVAYLTGAAGDLRLLPLPRLAAASRRARARAGRRRAVRALRDGRARARRGQSSSQPRVGRPAAVGAGRRRGR